MTELGYVEKPMLQWLAVMGWTVRDEEQMDAYGRVTTDPIVEKLLVPAIRRINPTVADDAQASRVVEQFRRVLVLPDPLEANQKTLAALRKSGSAAGRTKFSGGDADRRSQGSVDPFGPGTPPSGSIITSRCRSPGAT